MNIGKELRTVHYEPIEDPFAQESDAAEDANQAPEASEEQAEIQPAS